jgi:hypothetical protein
MPIVFLTFWSAFVPKGSLTLRHAFAWLIFPLIYVGYLLLCGPCYAFLDASVLGSDRVARNVGLMVVTFLALAQSLVLIDRVLGRRRRAAGAPGRSDLHATMMTGARELRAGAMPSGR